MNWLALLKYWKQIGLVVIIVLILTVTYFKGRSDEKTKWVAVQQQIVVHNAQLGQQQSQETIKIVTKYVDRIKYIHDHSNFVLEGIPSAITKDDDAKCVINNGFVRMWNNANSDTVSQTSRESDATASSVVLSAVASQHTKESTVCKETESQLINLQEWLNSVCKRYGCE